MLYWMQQSQRTGYNHALSFAIGRANEAGVPVLVYFGLTADFPEANARHYHFMLEGLDEVRSGLDTMGIRMVVRRGHPPDGVAEFSAGAVIVVVDRGYLRIQRQWREEAAARTGCAMIQVESDVIVPVEEASLKEEYSAGTFRPRITRRLGEYLGPFSPARPRKDSLGLSFDSYPVSPAGDAVAALGVEMRPGPVKGLRGGSREAKRLLDEFITTKLDYFTELRNDPSKDYASHMSPYLHFGQISPLYIAREIINSGSPGKDAYLEELIVRRELGINFTYYNPVYDSCACLPGWASATLDAHRRDPREYLYTRAELEAASTHDPYWNAAQREMISRGSMHGYMRMYWGKKVLEWSESPEEAYTTLLYLNNKYLLDGRDPNGFAGIAWCFGKHDRAWSERPVFGKVRYMNDRGLERKFNIDEYTARFANLET